MSEGNRIIVASKKLLAIAFALLLTGRLSAGDDDAKVEKSIEALGGKVGRSLAAPGRPIISVNLSSTNVTDARLKELAGLQSLETLDLSGPQVTEAGLKELAGFKSLQTLYLFGTQVTDVCIAELRKALPDCEISR